MEYSHRVDYYYAVIGMMYLKSLILSNMCIIYIIGNRKWGNGI